MHVCVFSVSFFFLLRCALKLTFFQIIFLPGLLVSCSLLDSLSVFFFFFGLLTFSFFLSLLTIDKQRGKKKTNTLGV